MLKKYIYRNVNRRPVNIGGYQFKEGQELESGILIPGFNEAVSNGFLELVEVKPESGRQDAPRAVETGNTGKVKVIFHMGVAPDGKEYLREDELDPKSPVDFLPCDPPVNETFDGWFEDAEFLKAVNTEKAKAPKKGEIHFYAKFAPKEDGDTKDSDESSENKGPGFLGRIASVFTSGSSESAPSADNPENI
jgi:uncharacterized repeat protein (TIGR02543 family)